MRNNINKYEADKRRVKPQNIIWWFVMSSLLMSIIYVIIEMTISPSTSVPNMPHQRIKGDYVLILSQCVFGAFAMLLPSILNKKMNLIIPSNMLIVYTLFLYCAIFLGEVRNFYYSIPYWDTILHTFSGAMLGSLGFSFISFLNKSEKIPVDLSPVFVAVFTFCFALTLGVIWEFYEFFCDCLLDTNMQKFALESGEQLLGHAAVVDTMKDLIVDAVGAVFISVIGYISLKYRKGWVEKLILKFRHDNPKTANQNK